ncbi:cation:H+ antiporter [Draconibacterium orientale]|uniref:Cation:H+ antiporter n=1 Tax=Draconibacterium orientale TaxID=1168034 RepID=X5DUV0_9BACT|nr:calcium/sodium antiporter [Draconibacterium orientale]AHW58955.1 sodium:proton exchanger [Draconibacterium orientale]SET51808.1 cation:H+ antiporter [Draconibacterium orientale]
MLLTILLVVLGFVCLIFGANWLVDGASALAKKYKVSDLAIGLTIVAFGTSAPELVVNIIGSLNGYSDIVFGNVIGSNNFNLFIILGISGIILPITVQSSTAWKEIPISFFVTGLILLFVNDFFFIGQGSLVRFEGAVLLLLFLLFLLYVFKQMKRDTVGQATLNNKSIIKILILVVAGLSGLIIGGQLVVINSVQIANHLGVSEKIIGLTIVAAGTSLPELVTSVIAAVKKNSDIAIGNVIGSNIFNILLILAISGVINPIAYNTKFNTDLFILLGGTAFLFISMLTGKRKKLDRWEAAILFIFYLSYTIFLITKEL